MARPAWFTAYCPIATLAGTSEALERQELLALLEGPLPTNW
jgi:hypothetical protein